MCAMEGRVHACEEGVRCLIVGLACMSLLLRGPD